MPTVNPNLTTADEVEAEALADDAKDLRSWLDAIGSRQNLMIKLYRKEPRRLKGIAIDGLLDTFNDFIDEEDIKEAFGGGTYQLVVHKRNAHGNFQFNTARTIKISGPPIVPELEETSSRSGNGNYNAGEKAIEAMKWMTKESMAKAERAAGEARHHGMDPMMLEAIMAPLRSQIESLSRTLQSKDEQLVQIINSRNSGEPTFQDRMLDKMVDGENARIEAIRTQHSSELRQLKEGHQEDIRRERDYFKQQIDMQEKRHERELEQVRENHKVSLEVVKNSFGTQIESLKAEIVRLQSDVQAKATEVSELRSKKDRSLPDQLAEMKTLKEALSDAFESEQGDDDSKKSVVERVLGKVLDSPDAITDLVSGVRGGGGAPSEPVPTPPGAVPQRRVVKKVVRRKPQPTTESGEPLPKLDPIEVNIAVQFMESAVDNGTEPANFARSAQGMIPRPILTYIDKVGVDKFLNQAAKLPQDSPLRSQKGRNFSREVARILLEGMPTS